MRIIVILIIGLFSVIASSQTKLKRIVDTTFAYQTTKLKKVSTATTQIVQKDRFYLNSKSNAFIKGGKNRVLLPVHLPAHTSEWYYVFSASRSEEDIKNTLQTFNLAGELSEIIQEKASLKQSVSSLNAPPGANICDIYVMTESDALLFREKEDFTFDLSSSRENYKSGIVTVKNASKQTIYLGLNNPDNLYGIHIAIEIIAVVTTNGYEEEIIRMPVITSYTVDN
jgi:hypothetical protein